MTIVGTHYNTNQTINSTSHNVESTYHNTDMTNDNAVLWPRNYIVHFLPKWDSQRGCQYISLKLDGEAMGK